MTGNDIYTRTMLLLGYNDHSGSIAGEEALKIRALAAINTIGAELCRMPSIQSLDDAVALTERQAEAAVWGVGMLLAGSEADGQRGKLFCELYNLKRAGVLAGSDRINDTLPVAGG